ncbi:CBS domain-containing protein [Kitasatospora sp. NPDC048722]|uniref:CBS domain-containing protein n=1 Tax=Kitasatospora sp. NPDC048722 TaxID=3155639 RepID=UPI0033C7D588
MQHRTVRDVMTPEVVVAHRETTFKEIAVLLRHHRISAVPVVDERNRPVGLVSEADLVRKESALLGEDRPLARGLHPHRHHLGEAELAEELMSSPAVTADPEWNLVETAKVMDRRHLKRLPVVDGEGRLIGIVSRADLLKPFLREDAEIRAEITGDVLLDALWLPAGDVEVTVEDGVVTLTGTVERRSLVPLVEEMCRSLDGVVAVRQSLDYRTDDTDTAGAPPNVRAAPRP